MRRPLLLIALTVFALLLAACGSSSDGSGTETVGESEKIAVEEVSSGKDAALGTRHNPVPLNSEVKVGPNWHVEVLEIEPDAWPLVEKENMFNDPPGEDRQFVMASFKVSYVGEESGTPWVSLSFRYLGSDGNTYSVGSSDSCGVIPNDLSDIGEQFPGASAEGNDCWSVPKDAIVGGSIIVEESFSVQDTRTFFEGVK